MNHTDDNDLCLTSDLSEDFCVKLDDDLDQIFALYLQSEEREQNTVTNNSPTLKQSSHNEDTVYTKNDESVDYQYALHLQSVYLEEGDDIPVISEVKQVIRKNEHDVTKDYQYAVHLQSQLLEENNNIQAISSVKRDIKHKSVPVSIVDLEWEVLDPNPDIHSLFLLFNKEYFWGSLNEVEVRWSPRMTLCAGVCSYEGRGGLCSVRLSQPLLKYRPRRDLVETLLHEMIHAYLFVTHNNKDHDSHGPEFLKHMNRINQQTGTRISVYHSFHDEVDVHRKHWWKCNGPCQKRSPFFGIVKRAMNRPPSSQDPWWIVHQAKCGGAFIKIKEPEDYAKKKNLKRKAEFSSGTKGKAVAEDIRKFFSRNSDNKHTEKSGQVISSSKLPQAPDIHILASPEKKINNVVSFSGQGFKLGSSISKYNDHHLYQNSSLKIGDQVQSITNSGTKSRAVTNGMKKFLYENNESLPGRSKTETSISSKTFLGISRGGSSSSTMKRPTSTSTKTLMKKNHLKNKEKETDSSKSQNKLFLGKGHALGRSVDIEVKKSFPLSSYLNSTSAEKSKARFLKEGTFSNLDDEGMNKVDGNFNTSPLKVCCPVCGTMMDSSVINAHLDTCLQPI